MNVWAPANASRARLPVKVWIHGGANEAGSISDPLYNGCNLGTDAVIVSVAYRLAALGFLALDSANITGNFAVQDVLLALRWVQENIHAFGGDKVCQNELRHLDQIIADYSRIKFCSSGSLPVRV